MAFRPQITACPAPTSSGFLSRLFCSCYLLMADLSIKARCNMLVRRKAKVSMDRHGIAAISVIGITLDLMGGIYLAYDLLGGKHGPLRTLTRGVTYGLFFGVGLGLPLGQAFGIAGGVALGITF